MPSTMQPVFPLSQEPPTQLVILPTEPTAHGTPHTLGGGRCAVRGQPAPEHLEAQPAVPV